MNKTAWGTLWLMVAVPLAVAGAMHIKAAFTIFLLFAFAGALARGFDWLCEHKWVRWLPFVRGVVALKLAGIWTGLVFFAAYTALPLLLQGGAEAVNGSSEFARQLPDIFKDVKANGPTWLTDIGISQQMIDSAAEWLRGHLSGLVGPGTEVATWLGHFLLRGTLGIGSALILPYVLIFILAFWPYEESAAAAAVRSFLPSDLAEMLIRWWEHFTCLSAKLFKAMGTSMLIFSVVFTVILLSLSAFGYHLSTPRAVFDGMLLGVTGGIPVFGGLLNYFTISVVSVVNFGFDWQIWLALFAATLVVHKLEMSVVTPWVVGSHLKFSTLGLALAFFAGFGCWGVTIQGIGMALFLLPWWRASKMLADDLRGA